MAKKRFKTLSTLLCNTYLQQSFNFVIFKHFENISKSNKFY